MEEWELILLKGISALTELEKQIQKSTGLA